MKIKLVVFSSLLVVLSACRSSTPSSAPPTSAPSASSTLETQADQVVAAYSNTRPWLTADGRVVFTSSRDGVSQVYVSEGSNPQSAVRRLPGPTERVTSLVLTADGRSALFTSDQNADGNFHVFRADLATNKVEDLTPEGQLHRDAPAVASARSDQFAFSAHSTRDEKARLFHSRGGHLREFFKDSASGYLASLSADGGHALYLRSISDLESVLFDVDTASGRSVRVYPPPGRHESVNATFSPNFIYVSTQTAGRPARVLALDPRSRKVLATYEEKLRPNAAIDGLFAAPTGGLMAISLDCGTHSELRFLDARTLRPAFTLQTPLGTLDGESFSSDGKAFAFSLSRPDHPAEIYIANTETQSFSPLLAEARPELARLPEIRATIENIPAFDKLSIPTNVYLPAVIKGKMPVIVLIHGGPTGSAHVRWNSEVRFFTAQGYAIVEPNIRGSTGFGFAYANADNKDKRGDALKDVESVNRWARAQTWADPRRMVIMGTSYGGYMTLLALGLQPDLWSAGEDSSGMSDLRTMERLEDQTIRVYDQTEFGTLGKEDALLLKWSPITYVDKIKSPVFIYQGVHDPITPQNEADQMVAALKARQVPFEYMLLADEGHGINRRANRRDYLVRVARFLASH